SDNSLGTALSPGREPLYLVNLAIDLSLGPCGTFVDNPTVHLVTLAADKNTAFGLQPTPGLANIVLGEVLQPHRLRTHVRRPWPGRGDLIDHIVVRLRRHEPTLPCRHIILPHDPENLSARRSLIGLADPRNSPLLAFPSSKPQNIVDVWLTANTPDVLVHLSDSLLELPIPKVDHITPGSRNIFELELLSLASSLRMGKSLAGRVILRLILVLHELKERRK